MKETLNLDKDWLYQKYIVEELSSHKIAKIVGCGARSVTKYLHLYGIPTRTKAEGVKLNRTGEVVRCTICGKEIYRKGRDIKKYDRFFCSWDCAKEYQSRTRGNPDLPDRWRRLRGYKRWRADVLARDGNVCKLCGSNLKLTAHHIIEAQTRPDLRLDLKNGITLCESCHIEIHRKGSEHFIESLQGVIPVE